MQSRILSSRATAIFHVGSGLVGRIKSVKNSLSNWWSEVRLARRFYRQIATREVPQWNAAPMAEAASTDFVETLYRRSVPQKLHLLLRLRVAARLASLPAIETRAQLCTQAGWTEEQVTAALLNNPDGPFSESEKLLLRYADDVSRTPIDVDFKVVRQLQSFFSDDQMREVVACITHENFRIRFEDALRIH